MSLRYEVLRTHGSLVHTYLSNKWNPYLALIQAMTSFSGDVVSVKQSRELAPFEIHVSTHKFDTNTSFTWFDSAPKGEERRDDAFSGKNLFRVETHYCFNEGNVSSLVIKLLSCITCTLFRSNCQFHKKCLHLKRFLQFWLVSVSRSPQWVSCRTVVQHRRHGETGFWWFPRDKVHDLDLHLSLLTFHCTNLPMQNCTTFHSLVP